MMNIQKGGSGSYEEDAPKKTPIVTKKMLADSGHDNLRDYLNAQRGLTRRKPKAEAAAPKAAAPKVSSVSRHRDLKKSLDAIRSKGPTTPGPITKAMTGEGGASVPPMPKSRRASGSVTEYEDEKPRAFAKGGSVSGRADGIASKGKTHCKMV